VTTPEEQLDALLAMARDLGRLDARLAQAERDHERAQRKSDTYSALRSARRERDRAAAALAVARRLHAGATS
jgi:hypothetical protein